MSYNNEALADVSPIVVDVETAALVNAADYLEPVQAARNLKDPEKVRADIEQRTADRDAKLGLDWNVGRVVALGWWTADRGGTYTVCRDECTEAAAIKDFWFSAQQRTIVGFNLAAFDLRYLIQRSRYLGIPYPSLDLGRYSRRGSIVDLFLELTFHEPQVGEACMRRGLQAFAVRFGLTTTDTIKGADIQALVEAGLWDQILAHLRADVDLTVQLARKLGVVTADLER